MFYLGIFILICFETGGIWSSRIENIAIIIYTAIVVGIAIVGTTTIESTAGKKIHLS